MLVTHLRPGHRLPHPDKSEAVQLKSLQGLLLKWLFPPTLVAELWPSSWILAWAVQKSNPVLKPVFSRRKRELRVLITRGQNWMNENSALSSLSSLFKTFQYSSVWDSALTGWPDNDLWVARVTLCFHGN